MRANGVPEDDDGNFRKLEGNYSQGSCGPALIGSLAQISLIAASACGACADKCHFFLVTGDPKNMPVRAAELLRSILPSEFHTGRQNSRQDGWRARDDGCVLKEWFMYAYQCPNAAAVRSFCPTASTPRKSP
jgi:Fe-S oxidoreductase